MPPATLWVRWELPAGWLENLQGRGWLQLSAPGRLHRCWPQTRARLQAPHNPLYVERCPCGGYRQGVWGAPPVALTGWLDRNTRLRGGGHVFQLSPTATPRLETVC